MYALVCMCLYNVILCSSQPQPHATPQFRTSFADSFMQSFKCVHCNIQLRRVIDRWPFWEETHNRTSATNSRLYRRYRIPVYCSKLTEYMCRCCRCCCSYCCVANEIDALASISFPCAYVNATHPSGPCRLPTLTACGFVHSFACCCGPTWADTHAHIYATHTRIQHTCHILLYTHIVFGLHSSRSAVRPFIETVSAIQAVQQLTTRRSSEQIIEVDEISFSCWRYLCEWVCIYSCYVYVWESVVRGSICDWSAGVWITSKLFRMNDECLNVQFLSIGV